jgi:hypothetical protein
MDVARSTLACCSEVARFAQTCVVVSFSTHIDVFLRRSSEKVLTFASGILLLGYGLKLGKEFYEEYWGEGAGNNEDEERGETAGLVGGDKHHGAMPYTDAPGERAKGKPSASLLVVAFLGSLDDLTLFVPMLAGKAIDWFELGACANH